MQQLFDDLRKTEFPTKHAANTNANASTNAPQETPSRPASGGGMDEMGGRNELLSLLPPEVIAAHEARNIDAEDTDSEKDFEGAAEAIQRTAQAYLHRRTFVRQRGAVVRIQAHWKGYLARRRRGPVTLAREAWADAPVSEDVAVTLAGLELTPRRLAIAEELMQPEPPPSSAEPTSDPHPTEPPDI